jgi:hypothetical protein
LHPTPTDPLPPPTIEGPRVWYGYQLFISDIAFDFTSGAALGGGGNGLALFAIGGAFFGGPILHGIHGRPLAVVGSLALRIGLPLAFAGAAAKSSSTSSCTPSGDGDFGGCPPLPNVGAAVFGILGLFVAQILDDAALAWESTSVPAEAKTPTAAIQWTPTFSVVRASEQREAPMLGVRGVF